MFNLIFTTMAIIAMIDLSLAANPTCPDCPAITYWTKCTGKKGYGGQLSDVQKIEYSSNYVYITSTSIPGTYTVGTGGWADCPYLPVAQPTFRVKIPLNPTQATSSPTAVSMGTAGLLLNGVSLYSADDGNSYNSTGIWKRNAYFFEAYSFDSSPGHASVGTSSNGGTVVNGLYHHHSLPILYGNASVTTSHSPLLSFALDGYPIYGPYGYITATDATTAIKKLTTSYAAWSYSATSGARSIWPSVSTSATKTGANIGPSLTTTYKLNTLSSVYTPLTSGAFLYDYVYTANSGDLDAYNMRFQVTPEYPAGIRCYIFTGTGTGATITDYPYLFGPGNYYGVVVSTSTYVTVSETTTTYFLYSSATNFKPLFIFGFSSFILTVI